MGYYLTPSGLKSSYLTPSGLKGVSLGGRKSGSKSQTAAGIVAA